MAFEKGDIVMCVIEHFDLELHKSYTVRDLSVSLNGKRDYLILEEIEGTYSTDHFVKVTKPGGGSKREAAPSYIRKTDSVAPTITIQNPVDEGMLSAKTASKNDKNKIDLSLIPYISNREHAKALMVGEKKYGRYNYCKGHKASQLTAAAMRHLNAWFDGEDNDPDDGQHHLGSVMACCSMILRQQELKTLTDDRYKVESK